MNVEIALFVIGLVVLPTTAVLAFRWALRNGEFRQLNKIALSIFDDDEPVGTMTDFFPGKKPRALSEAPGSARAAAQPKVPKYLSSPDQT